MKNTKTPRCRVCHQSNSYKCFLASNFHGRHLLNNKTYPIYYCPNCQTYYLDSVEKSHDYFRKAYPSSYYPSSGFISRIFSSLGIIKVWYIQKLFPNQKNISLLDVGSGQGEFLQSLPDLKFKKTGIEISTEATKITSLKKLNIITGNIDTYQFNNQKFDCITLWHVLEHLPDPQSTLNKLYNLLKPRGFLILATPNSDSLGFKWGRKYYFHLDSPRHLFIPNRHSLNFLLSNSKFYSIKFRNPFLDYPLDLFWSLRNSPLKFLIYPLYPLFKFLSSETIITTAQK